MVAFVDKGAPLGVKAGSLPFFESERRPALGDSATQIAPGRIRYGAEHISMYDEWGDLTLEAPRG
jgi:hypothetical protein